MYPVESNIEGKQARYGDIRKKLEEEGFVLGENWDYQAGFLDGVLKQEYDNTLYLRIPVEVVEGELDSDDALLRAGTPFLLKHRVNTGYSQGHTENPTYDPLQAGYLVNQFQEPLDRDEELDNVDYWAEQARHRLSRIEYLFE
ncbi:MAG: hypothetical protein H0Z33_15905 [Bacillaceae bacterium]|nr:hypothetical protein [Bacillaceae bacterium]